MAKTQTNVHLKEDITKNRTLKTFRTSVRWIIFYWAGEKQIDCQCHYNNIIDLKSSVQGFPSP